MPSTITILRQRERRRAAARRGSRAALRWLSGAAASLAVLLALLTGVAGVAIAGAYAYFTRDLPDVGQLALAFGPDNNQFFQTTQIFDRTGQHLLYEVIDPRGGDRQWLTLDQSAARHIPQSLLDATVAIEDRTFWTNPGYDLYGIARALVSNLRGQAVQGGSSISQQLVKNTLIDPAQRLERSYTRKLREVLLAGQVTERFPKAQILEWYLNTNFYGNLAYGIDAAALVYFDKHAYDLDLAESAMLAAVPQYPLLNPIDAPQEARDRQRLVLDQMVREGYITPARAEAAYAEPLIVKTARQRFDIQAPHFSIYVRQQLNRMFGEDFVNRNGLKVYTTLDLDLQRQVECAARTQLLRLSGGDPNGIVPAEGSQTCESAALLLALRPQDAGVDHHLSNAAVMVMRPATGEILAMLGSADYWNDAIDGRFNVATDGLRQPGSSFKPFTYLTAFAQGYSPASMLLDVRTVFSPPGGGAPYVPDNYDRRFHGPVRMRVALQRSYNIPAVQTMNLVGVDNVIRTAHRMGLNTLDQTSSFYGLALTLGGGEVTLADMTYAYGVIANGGVMAGTPVPGADRRPGYRTLDPAAILRVEDRAGRVLFQYDRPETQTILSSQLAYLMENVMSDEQARWAAFGHPNPLEIDRPAGAKTGTTDDFRDNWTLGFTPQLVAGVWVGNTDGAPMQNVTGLSGAAPIWQAVMQWGLRDTPPQGWTAPAGISEVAVCDPGGLLPTKYCPNVVKEVFIAGTEPAGYDNLYQAFQVNRETGKLATVYTPPELVDEKVYLILPPEAADWLREAGLPRPPGEYDTLYTPPVEGAGAVAITSPRPFTYVRGIVTLTSNATAPPDQFSLFRVQVGAGLNPTEWVQVGGDRGEQVENGVLQTWDTAGLDGLYTLQLLVLKQDQSFQTATLQVTVDNQPPTVALLLPASGQSFSKSGDESIILQADPHDNLSLAKVEFYVDGQVVETATVLPYSTRWKISSAGQHQVWVRAYDAAGNSAESEHVTVNVGP
ncbi:MAG: transglycosylase domain-containing protein [Chloroflexi bacterium]|nr:transglycosylase domain-containing protein [Chloroflexota bacterium]